MTRAPYLKKFGIEKIYNKTNFLYTSMHKNIYMDKDNLMPKKRKDFFINRNIVTSRKRLKRNQIICDYMGPIVLYIGYICDGKSHHTFFGHILWLCCNYL